MERISTNLTNNDMQYYMRKQEVGMNTVGNKIGSQKRILSLRDDPVGAAHSTRYQSLITRLNQFSDNVSFVKGNNAMAGTYVQDCIDTLQRVRELAIQGASDTYSRDDKKKIAVEIDELLNHMVQIANANEGDVSLFSGDKKFGKAFRVIKGRVPGAAGQRVTGVEYIGTTKKNMSEISEASYISNNFAGNEIFWSENQQVFSTRDAGKYQVQENSEISIDGNIIKLKAGDNIHAVIAKINDSKAPVKAHIDPVRNSLILETTEPHQLWMEDIGGKTVLQDLGILSENTSRPPYNVAIDANLAGGSMFDMVIYLRDKLYDGDVFEIGGSGIRGIDNALDSLLTSVADIGAKDQRLDFVFARLSNEELNMQQRNSREVDLDVAEAMMNYKKLELTHNASLRFAARVLQPTLLDFLR